MPAVELLEQDHPRELVGQGEATEGEPVIDPVELEPLGAAHHEARIAPALAALLEEGGEALGVVLLPTAVQQGDESAVGKAAPDLLVLTQLDELEPGVAGQQLLVVLDVVCIGRPQAADGQDDDPHPAILARMSEPEDGPERQINIHFSPEIMAGVYANFANVSHSDYEFTVTFARVDHEVDDEEIPGVVVSRVNLSPKFMRELVDAMEDNYSKWQTREGIKNLPEFGSEDEPPAPQQP